MAEEYKKQIDEFRKQIADNQKQLIDMSTAIKEKNTRLTQQIKQRELLISLSSEMTDELFKSDVAKLVQTNESK